MALRAVPDHPKFSELKVQLKLPRYAVLGCLEAIWHFTGRFTPQGNIGKYSDQAIEEWVGWEGESGELIKALVETHWIDRDGTHRLLVHDWHQHADKATKNALNRANIEFFRADIVPPLYVQSTDGVHTLYVQGAVTQSSPDIQNSQITGEVSRKSLQNEMYVHSTDGVRTVSPLPVPEPVPGPEPEAEPEPGPGPRLGPSPAAGFSPGVDWPSVPDPDASAGLSFHDQAEMVASRVIEETGLTGRWLRDDIVKQAEFTLKSTAATDDPATMDNVSDGMAYNWKKYDACVQKQLIKFPVTPERFFSDGLWKNAQKWGFKKGMSANGIVV